MAAYMIVLIGLTASALGFPVADQKNADTIPSQVISLPFPYYSKEDWGGRAATSTTPLSLPVSLVTIHHTYEPAACFSAPQCKEAMRKMQKYHQDGQGWVDIGYNFAIGSDGGVYEGRGWTAVGAHAVGVNNRSIGIVFIGDYVSDLPPPRSIQAAKDLITYGIRLGYISRFYNIIGHRQVSATECPGQSLYTEISSWNRFLPDFDLNA